MREGGEEEEEEEKRGSERKSLATRSDFDININHNTDGFDDLPLPSSSMRANLARDPRIFRRSETTEGVISLYDGTKKTEDG